MANILVIDDDASLLQMMSLMLKRAGHNPILANDGQEGIDAANRDLPDMAIVDVMMPDLSGYEVCRILRNDSHTRNIPLMVLTALSQPEQRDMAMEAGADDFITKPVTRDDLTKHVDELLASGARNIPSPATAAQRPSPSIEHISPIAYQEDTQPAAAAQPTPPTGPLTEPFPHPGSVPAAPSTLPLIAVMGLSGGVGATTLAVNIGLMLMQTGRACIIDLNTQVGQVAIQLKMAPPRVTWHDLLNVSPGTDKRAIGGALMLDRSVGVAILAAPMQPVSDRLSESTLSYILRVLSEGFHSIVADLPSLVNTMNMTTLRQARHIVLVVGDDPADLLLVKDALSNIQGVGLPGNKHIVLNHTRPHGVSVEDVMQTLNSPVLATFPYEPTQVSALTQGIPLVVSQPDTLFSRTVAQLVRQL
jgi:CheY-like chemotaxis protein/MinD-like ATPase involved in chromosome partitioning or flagellar assembly